MEQTKLIKRLCDLIQLDVDAVEVYSKSIEHIEDPEIKNQLIHFQDDHRRHVKELTHKVEALGGVPPKQTPDLKGILLKGLTALQSMTGTKGALKAMQTSEEITNKTYDSILTEATHAPPDVISLIRKNREDERRHLQYILEALERLANAA